MEPFRLRMKIGAHEFEAEGDQETVERQFALWRELLTITPTSASPPPPTVPQQASGMAGVGAESLNGVSAAATTPIEVGSAIPPGYSKIFSQDGALLSLTVLPGEDRVGDAGLLLLLGHREFNKLDQVGGGVLLEGLQRSGYRIDRVDRVYDRSPDLVMRTGAKRGVKYRLNNPGLARARELAKELIGMVP
jgi:hypothetical protein